MGCSCNFNKEEKVERNAEKLICQVEANARNAAYALCLRVFALITVLIALETRIRTLYRPSDLWVLLFLSFLYIVLSFKLSFDIKREKEEINSRELVKHALTYDRAGSDNEI